LYKKHKLDGSFHFLSVSIIAAIPHHLIIMMRTTMVAVFVSACFMQEASGAFLRGNDQEDDMSCKQCLPAANKFLGIDCKDLRCLVQAAAATKLSSAEDRKKASAAYGAFRGCAKENKCNLDIAKAAADEFHIDFEAIASLFQVDDESTEDDDESTEDDNTKEAERDENAPEPTDENRESEEKEAERQIILPPSFLQVDEESTQDEDADEDADAASEQESELKEAERQLAEDKDDREEESAFEGSEQEEAEDHDDSLVVAESDSQGEAMREAAEGSAYTASTLSEDDGSCAKCLAPANHLVDADCKDFVCVVKAFNAKKKLIMASEGGRNEATAVEESVRRCAKENKCDMQPAITAAYELGMDLSELSSLIQVDDSSLNMPEA